MVAEFVNELQFCLSPDRLEAYRPEGGDDLEMLTNYFWNIDLAEAIVPCLHALELALRNSIHASLTKRFDNDMWFYQPGFLDSGQLGQLATALRDVARRPPLKSGKLVAALSFGFWVALLSDRYQRDLWQPDAYRLLAQVFPHADGPDFERHLIHNRLNKIRELRNRVFHYEAIWYRPHLRHEHADIHQAIEWISPMFHEAVHAVDDFSTVLDSRDEVRAALMEHLRIAAPPSNS